MIEPSQRSQPQDIRSIWLAVLGAAGAFIGAWVVLTYLVYAAFDLSVGAQEDWYDRLSIAGSGPWFAMQSILAGSSFVAGLACSYLSPPGKKRAPIGIVLGVFGLYYFFAQVPRPNSPDIVLIWISSLPLAFVAGWYLSQFCGARRGH